MNGISFLHRREDTTNVTPTKGDTMEQKEEGGGTVDRKTKKSTYEAAYQLFIKKNQSQPFKTIDGIIEGNYRLLFSQRILKYLELT